MNPDHLWIGTKRDNTQDMIAKGRSTLRRGGYRIPQDQIKAIFLSGDPHRVLAKRYGISRSYVWMVQNGLHRTEVTSNLRN